MDLFDQPAAAPATPGPLADRMRPRTLDEVVGQQHLIGPGKVLRRALEEGRLHSMILWGPPGTGKTTLALLMAQVAGARFVPFSAVLAGVKEIRQVMAEAEAERARARPAHHPLRRRDPPLQQGAAGRLPAPRREGHDRPRRRHHGEPVLRGQRGAALPLPRLRAPAAGRGRPGGASSSARSAIAERGLGALGRDGGRRTRSGSSRVLADGDARSALNILELAVELEAARPGAERRRHRGAPSARRSQKKALLYDKAGEEHYNLISALHKSLRDSDPDGALYWLGRMLEAGEDPLYVARRLVRFASEDVGNADPQRAARSPSTPRRPITSSARPRASWRWPRPPATSRSRPSPTPSTPRGTRCATTSSEQPAEPVPLHLRNAPTGLMANLGYGKGYQYAHDAPDAQVDQEHLPDALRGRVYYRPTDRGLEKELAGPPRRLARAAADSGGRQATG